MLYLKKFVFNTLQENTYIIYDQATRACIVLDPGCYTTQEKAALSQFIEQNGLEVTLLVNTHAHLDHIVGNAYIKKTYGVQLVLHAEDVTLFHLATTHAASYGFVNYIPATIDAFICEGQVLTLGESVLQVLHTPGHSPGHVALYSPKDKICWTGDALFKQYIGRTDLPGGNLDVLLQSIRQKLFTLREDVIIYPGHGMPSTIGIEKAQNPFFN